MSSTAGAIPTPVLRHAVQAAARALLSLLVALALVMLLRRFSGAFVQPLSGLTLIVIAAAMAIVAAAVRLMLLESLTNAEPRTNSLLFALPGLSAAILLTALTLPGTPALAIALAWFLLIGSEGQSWLVARRPELLRWASTHHTAANLVASTDSAAEIDAELPAGLIQQLTRIRENGRESIHAVLLAEIPPGDRQTALHVAFCPPLEAKPQLTAHALDADDADDADVRITQAETFGARIEIRLPAVAAERRTALVELLGTATSR